MTRKTKAKRGKPLGRRTSPYPPGTTPEDVARALGFVPPHQRPEVQAHMRERERRKRASQESG